MGFPPRYALSILSVKMLTVVCAMLEYHMPNIP